MAEAFEKAMACFVGWDRGVFALTNGVLCVWWLLPLALPMRCLAQLAGLIATVHGAGLAQHSLQRRVLRYKLQPLQHMYRTWFIRT